MSWNIQILHGSVKSNSKMMASMLIKFWKRGNEMREILFRGKTLTGRWVEGAYYKQEEFYGDKEDAHIIITSKENLTYDQALEFAICIPETVGQYTGLTDKNGKKIFEGDIIENINQQIFVVEYGRHDLGCCNCCYESHDALGFYMKNKFGSAESDEKVWEDIEVIGNIHDNPELLGGNNCG